MKGEIMWKDLMELLPFIAVLGLLTVLIAIIMTIFIALGPKGKDDGNDDDIWCTHC